MMNKEKNTDTSGVVLASQSEATFSLADVMKIVKLTEGRQMTGRESGAIARFEDFDTDGKYIYDVDYVDGRVDVVLRDRDTNTEHARRNVDVLEKLQEALDDIDLFRMRMVHDGWHPAAVARAVIGGEVYEVASIKQPFASLVELEMIDRGPHWRIGDVVLFPSGAVDCIVRKRATSNHGH